MTTAPPFIVAYFAAALADATGQLAEVDEVSAWMQTWGSTACGHRGIGGCAMTTGFVVAVTGRVYGDNQPDRALFYSQGRLLHNVELDRAAQWAIERRHVPGTSEPWKQPPA